MSELFHLTINDIRFLLELEKSGVLLKAGALFNMSPSSASRNFTRIKAVFKNPIFKAEAGRWRATEYFYSIRPNLAEILAQAQTLLVHSFDPRKSTRTYTLSSMMAEVDTVVQGVLPKLIDRSPHARLDLSKHDNEFAAVVDGLADFAIVTAVDLPPDVHVLKLYPVDRVILVRKGHPLSERKRPITIKSLIPYDRVTIRTGRSVSWTCPEQSLFPFERFMEHTRFSTSRFNSAWGAMEKTDLIAVCGWRAAEIAMRAYHLTALPLPIDFDERDLWNVLIWSDQKHKDPAIVWMRSLFAEWAEEEQARMQRLREEGKGPPRYARKRSQINGSEF